MNTDTRIVVAIDGPAGAGKSTIARRLANKLGFLYIDSGAMYRAVALWAIRAKVDLSDASSLQRLAEEGRIEFEAGSTRVLLNGEDVTDAIRSPQIPSAASRVSTIPGVRRALVAKQRQMSEQASVVMEGRDIGSVVFPQAQVKVFLDADPRVRASRRILEMQQKGQAVQPAEVEKEIQERDLRDSTRSEAPLVMAADAIRVDSSHRSPEEVEQVILGVIRERTPVGKGSV